MRRLLAAAGLTAALAAAPAAPVPKDSGRRPVYFPTRVGTTWVQVSNTGTEITYRVAAAVAEGGEVRVTVAGEIGGQATQTAEYLASDKGLRWAKSNGVPVLPPAELVRSPHRAGDSWPLKTAGGVDLAMTVTAHEPERVKVPAGTYRAVRVTRTGTQGGEAATVTHWYAPDVGLVRAELRPTGTVWELKSFTPAED